MVHLGSNYSKGFRAVYSNFGDISMHRWRSSCKLFPSGPFPVTYSSCSDLPNHPWPNRNRSSQIQASFNFFSHANSIAIWIHLVLVVFLIGHTGCYLKTLTYLPYSFAIGFWWCFLPLSSPPCRLSLLRHPLTERAARGEPAMTVRNSR